MDETIALHLPKHGDFECSTFSFNRYYGWNRTPLVNEVLDLTQWDVKEVTAMLKVELAIVAASLSTNHD